MGRGTDGELKLLVVNELWWNFRVIRQETLKLCWHDSNMWVPISMESALAWWTFKTEGTAHRHLTFSDSYNSESIWGWRSISSAFRKTDSLLAQEAQSRSGWLLPGFGCIIWLLHSSLFSRSFLDPVSHSGHQQCLLGLLFPLKYQVIVLFVLCQRQWFWSITSLCLVQI